jgi:hypothetical protein
MTSGEGLAGDNNHGHSPMSGNLSIDTVGISAGCSMDVSRALEDFAGRRLTICGAGEVEREEIRIGSLPGSYSPNIWLRIDEGRHGWPASLRVEGSVQRHLTGANWEPFSAPLGACARYLVDVARWWIPEAPEAGWRLERADYALPVLLEGIDPERFFSLLNRSLSSSTAKGMVRSWGTTVAKGPTKCYWKEREMRAHGAGIEDRLRAEGVIRFETTYRRKRIERYTLSNLEALEEPPLREAAMARLRRFMQDGIHGASAEMNVRDAAERLVMQFGTAQGMALYGTWRMLCEVGELATSATMKRTTYYRHRAALRSVGLSWRAVTVELAPVVRLVPLTSNRGDLLRAYAA